MPRKIITVTYGVDNNLATYTKRFETAKELQERIAREEERAEAERNKRANTEPLMCDACGLVMGRVYENDLNGSRFYHTGCIK